MFIAKSVFILKVENDFLFHYIKICECFSFSLLVIHTKLLSMCSKRLRTLLFPCKSIVKFANYEQENT